MHEFEPVVEPEVKPAAIPEEAPGVEDIAQPPRRRQSPTPKSDAGASLKVAPVDPQELDFTAQVDSTSAWTKFWSAHWLRYCDKRSEYDLISEAGEVNKPLPEKDVATWNKWAGGLGLIFFGGLDIIATIVLHEKGVYSTTRMHNLINLGEVPDAILNSIALAGGGSLATVLFLSQPLTAIGYRFNRPKIFSTFGYVGGWAGLAALHGHLFNYSNKQGVPAGAITYDSTLVAPTLNSLMERIVLTNTANDKNYTLGSIIFTGVNRQSVQVVSPPALLTQNGTHFNLTFNQPVVIYYNNNSTEIFLQYENPNMIVPPIRDVHVEVLNNIPKSNETTSEVFYAPIHGLDLAKPETPGLVDWPTVFNPSSNVTVDSANEIIIGPLQLNNDGSYSLYSPQNVVPYHEALKRGIKNPEVSVKLYTSTFDSNTWNMGANNVTTANLHNNTATLLDYTRADGMVFDIEDWSNPVPVNGTNAANLLGMRSVLPSDKTISVTLPLNDADIIWPKATLQQVAKAGVTFYPVGYRTFLPGQLAGYSSPLDVLQNMTNYYIGIVGNKIEAIALSCATQCYTVNETMPFEPYVPFGRAVVTGLKPGQYPTIAESLYSETCLVTNSNCAGGTPLGVEVIVSPPDAHSASQQGLMVDRASGTVCTGQMITPGEYSFDTMTNAAKVIAKSGHNVAVSNQYWDQDGQLTKAIANQYFNGKTAKPTPSPTMAPTHSQTPSQNSTHAERAESHATGRKLQSLGGAGINLGDESSNLPSLGEFASTAIYSGLSSMIATIARDVMKDLLIAHKKDAAAKAAGKPEEEQSAVADYMFLLGNISLTLLPTLYSTSSIIDAQTKVMSLAMVLAISFGLQVINKTPQLVNGVIAGTAPIAMKTLESLIAGNQVLMKDVILMFSALIISSGLSFVTDKFYEPSKAYLRANVYEPGKALLTNGIGTFARSYNAANRPAPVAQAPVAEQDYQRSFAAV